MGGGVRIGGEGRNVSVTGADDDADTGSGQSFDDGGIGAVEPHFLDRRGLEELDGFRRRREVVGDLADVNSDEWVCICCVNIERKLRLD